MTDAVKVLVQHRRRLTVAFYRKPRKSEVDAWDFTDMQASGRCATCGTRVWTPVLPPRWTVDGIFAAYRATDGKALWQFDAGVGIAAGPMTYAVGDTQYVAVLSGPPALYSAVASRTGPNRVLAFALGGTANRPPPPAPRDPISASNVQIPATTTELAEGGALFSAYCRRCHSFTSNLVKGDAVPDLRRTTAAVHATFDSIVIGGATHARHAVVCERLGRGTGTTDPRLPRG